MVRIPAFHAGGPGSIPGVGGLLMKGFGRGQGMWEEAGAAADPPDRGDLETLAL